MQYQTNETQDQYSVSARYYDLLYSERFSADGPFYLERAAEYGGAVLELGCGTGRITLPLAQAGHRVVALDNSPAMLDALRQKLAREPAEVRERVDVVLQDMESFDLTGRFGLIISPFRAFQHVMTVEGQRTCLQSIARHLEADGRFIYDAFTPSVAHIARMLKHGVTWTLENECADLASGHVIRRYCQVRPMPVQQMHRLWFKHEEYDGAGTLVQTQVERMEMRWQYRWEAHYLLELCGFAVEEAYGDYRGAPIDEAAKEMIFVCKKRDGPP